MIRTAVAALLVVLALASPAAAAPFAESYVDGFIDHWKTSFGKQNTIVVGVLIAGAVGIFVITRGKRLK